jgi:hypothetical protein
MIFCFERQIYCIYPISLKTKVEKVCLNLNLEANKRPSVCKHGLGFPYL